MNFNGKIRFLFRHVLFATQILSFLILFLINHPVQLLSPILYCLAVFPAPLLLILYGERYFNTEKFWMLAGIPFLTEIMIVYIFGGSMIYGVYMNDRSSILFMWLLIAYVVVAAVCVSGYCARYCRAKISVMGSS